MFSLNALDPKLVWHIEKETKERDYGVGAGRPKWTEKLRMRGRGTQRQQKGHKERRWIVRKTQKEKKCREKE